jgi:hypothetical protein
VSSTNNFKGKTNKSEKARVASKEQFFTATWGPTTRGGHEVTQERSRTGEPKGKKTCLPGLIVRDNETDYARSKVRDTSHSGERDSFYAAGGRERKRKEKVTRGRVRLGEEDKRPPQRMQTGPVEDTETW